jgi:hypothetical protein
MSIDEIEDDFEGLSGADLLAEHDAGGECWSVERGDGEVSVWFTDEIAHGASRLIDELATALEEASLAGVASARRDDRELVTVAAEPGETLDLDEIGGFVDAWMRDALGRHGALQFEE